jgi:hypothetical protein
MADICVVCEKKQEMYHHALDLERGENDGSSAIFFDRTVRVRVAGSASPFAAPCSSLERVSFYVPTSPAQLLQRREPEPEFIAGLGHLLATGYSRLALTYPDVRLQHTISGRSI